ncbi:MAG TPA: hypothetical protein VGC85_07650 [Chthoniobacterales bacterium]
MKLPQPIASDMKTAALLPDERESAELAWSNSVELEMSNSPQEDLDERERRPLPVKLLIAYEIAGREERWEVGTFRFVSEAVVAAKALVDSFLLRHHKTQLRGRQLYDHFVKYGPDVYVDAAIAEPVFLGWEYARRRVRQLCGVW